MITLAPEQIERYRIIEGVGTYKDKLILRAFNQRNDQTVLIELYNEAVLGDETRRLQFEKRGMILDSLSSSIIVPVIQYGSYGDQPYIVYPYMDGGTLREIQTKRKRFEPTDVLPVIERLATAIDIIHDRKAVFGNLRPENVVFNSEGVPHIIGFLIPPAVPGPEANLSYFSPEQLNHKPLAPQSDNYALVILIYELLAGFAPFHGLSAAEISEKVLQKEIPSITDVAPQLDKGMDEFFRKYLTYLPQDRPLLASDIVNNFKLINKITTHVNHNATQIHSSSVSSDTIINMRSSSVYSVDFEEFPNWMFLYDTIQIEKGAIPLDPSIGTEGNIFDTIIGTTASQQNLSATIARKYEISDEAIRELEPATVFDEDEEVELTSGFSSARIISILIFILSALLLSGLALFALISINADRFSPNPETDAGETTAPVVLVEEGEAVTEIDQPALELEDEATADETEVGSVATADAQSESNPEPLSETESGGRELIAIPAVPSAATNGAGIGPLSPEYAPPSQTFMRKSRANRFDVAGWYMYNNANVVRDTIFNDGILYGATGGGLTIWNIDAGVADKMTTYDGLLSNDLREITLCNLPDPTLVIATDEGINLYDIEEERFSTLTQSDRQLIGKTVNTVACTTSTQDMMLYVGYQEEGISVHDFSDGTRRQINKESGLASDRVQQILLIDETLWVNHGDGLTIYTEESETAQIFSEADASIPSQGINDMAFDPRGFVWLATDRGLLVGNTEAQWTLYTASNTNLPPGLGTAVSVSNDGTIWYGSAIGQICLFVLEALTCDQTYQHQTENIGLNNEITALESSDDYVIMAHRQDGIRFSLLENNQPPADGAWRSLFIPQQLPNNQITALTELQKEVWIGTREGLYRAPVDDLTGESWQIYNTRNATLPSNWITALALDNRDGLWVGTFSGALYFANDQWRGVPILDSITVNTIAYDSANNLTWFGTDRGVYTHNGVDASLELQIPAEDIQALYIDNERETLYVGTSSGLFGALTIVGFETFSTGRSPLTREAIRVITPGPDGKLYVGNGETLYLFDPTEKGFEEVSGPSGGTISDLVSLRNGELLISTSSSGLFYNDGLEWLNLGPETGLPSSGINDILIDTEGTLWVASQNDSAGGGLARYVPYSDRLLDADEEDEE